GIGPCRLRTVPLPAGGGSATMRPGSSAATSSDAPTTSAMESSAPTSCSSTSSGATPWILPSASARLWKAACANAFARGGRTAQGRSVADAGGNRDHRARNEPRHDGRQGAFHAGADHDGIRLAQVLGAAEEPVDPRHADVEMTGGRGTHESDGDARLFGDRDV